MGGLKAPTPAPHTPVTYLKGGGAGMFSAACIKALMKAKINPEWCGSYAYVSEDVIRPAKKKCEAWDNASRRDRNSGKLERPTAEDRYLASCQSGHLVRDAAFREAGEAGEGGTRGDPCANIVDGYVSRQAPSIPQQGHASDDESQHGSHTRMEEDQAEARNRRGQGNPYSQAHRQADEDARVRAHVARHPGDWEQVEEETAEQPAGRDKKQGATGSGATSTAATDSSAGGTAAKSATAPKDKPVKKITGKSAAECLNNWRKAAEKEMKQKVQDDVAKNKAHVEAVMAEEGASTPAEAAASLQQKVDQQEAALRKLEKRGASKRVLDAKREALTRARTRQSRFCSARCLAEQGTRMSRGRGRTAGRAA